MKFFHRLRDAVAPLVDYSQIKAQLGRFRTARDGGLKFRGRIGPLLGFDERSAQLIMGEGIFWEFRDGFSEQRNGFVVLLQVKVGLAQFEVCQIRAWLFLDDLFKFGHDVLIFSILSFEQGLVEQIRNFDFVLGISAARFFLARGSTGVRGQISERSQALRLLWIQVRLRASRSARLAAKLI